jgi:hypothetical protein
MKTAAALLAAVAIAALTLLPSTPALAAGHRIQINEIYYNSPGTDTGSNSSLNAEWVRLYNTSSSKISLTNWTLRDAAGHVFKFATATSRSTPDTAPAPRPTATGTRTGTSGTTPATPRHCATPVAGQWILAATPARPPGTCSADPPAKCRLHAADTLTAPEAAAAI